MTVSITMLPSPSVSKCLIINIVIAINLVVYYYCIITTRTCTTNTDLKWVILSLAKRRQLISKAKCHSCPLAMTINSASIQKGQFTSIPQCTTLKLPILFRISGIPDQKCDNKKNSENEQELGIIGQKLVGFIWLPSVLCEYVAFGMSVIEHNLFNIFYHFLCFLSSISVQTPS